MVILAFEMWNCSFESTFKAATFSCCILYELMPTSYFALYILKHIWQFESCSHVARVEIEDSKSASGHLQSRTSIVMERPMTYRAFKAQWVQNSSLSQAKKRNSKRKKRTLTFYNSRRNPWAFQIRSTDRQSSFKWTNLM